MTRTEERSERRAGGYVLAAAVGAVGGGLAVALTKDRLPQMLAEMRERMQEACGEHCACMTEETVKEEAAGKEPSAPN